MLKYNNNGKEARLTAAMRELTVGKNDAGQRLDKFLCKALVDIPHSLLYKSIRTKKIKVNRKRATPEQILCEGDMLELFISDEFFKDTGENDTELLLSRTNTQIKIIYEDENIILVNKDAGVSVHEDEGNVRNNLITYIQAYLWRKGEYDPKNEQSFAPALCNRIDRNTAGIVIAAKNAEALRCMNERIRQRRISKFYLAAVHGAPERAEATLNAYLEKNEKTNTVRVSDKPFGSAKKIITKYKVLAKKSGYALVEVELVTGRTHQIRAHFAHIGHSLLGDGKYGQNKDDRALGYKHQALCSYKLKFPASVDSDLLSYLDGREFSIPKKEIFFTSLFF